MSQTDPLDEAVDRALEYIVKSSTPELAAATSKTVLVAAINAEIAKAVREARVDEVQRLLEPGGYTDGDGMREQMRDRLTDLRELPHEI